MAGPLDGVTVAITENRYPEQLTTLLERQGATVLSCPLLRETPVEDAEGARQFIALCEQTRIDYIVFYTGVGVDMLFRAFNRPELISRSRVLARGPKAVNALKRAGARVDLVADSPTTDGIFQTLMRENLSEKTVLIQLYGHGTTELAEKLAAKGATVLSVSIYRYAQASDSAAVEDLIRRILDDKIQAITFTSATQVPFLFSTADGMGCGADFRARLTNRVVVVSVGEITSRALEKAGVSAHVEPTEPKMGPMVKALADFVQGRAR
jgi:uroporphyrinogen-III synthase